MKTLILLRHAKSSWKELGLADHQRPLNKRGQRDAPRMGKRIAAKETRPECVISSHAVRALTTAKIVAAELGFADTDVIINEGIYGASPGDLIELIRGLDDRLSRIMLVGHNPTFTEVANLLGDRYIDNMPTCAIAVLELPGNAWKEIETGTLLDFDYPKKNSL